MTKIYTLPLLCLFALTLPVTAREAEFKKIKESWTLQADGTQVYRQSKSPDAVHSHGHEPHVWGVVHYV